MRSHISEESGRKWEKSKRRPIQKRFSLVAWTKTKSVLYSTQVNFWIEERRTEELIKEQAREWDPVFSRKGKLIHPFLTRNDSARNYILQVRAKLVPNHSCLCFYHPFTFQVNVRLSIVNDAKMWYLLQGMGGGWGSISSPPLPVLKCVLGSDEV